MKKIILMITILVILAGNGFGQTKDRELVRDSIKLLAKLGYEIKIENIIFFSTREETNSYFNDRIDKEKALNSVAFTVYGKSTIYINTWDPILWKNLTDERITEPEMVKASNVIIAAILCHEYSHTQENAEDYKSLTSVEKQKKVIQSEILGLSKELEILMLYQRKGTKYLEYPIENTTKSIEDNKSKLLQVF